MEFIINDKRVKNIIDKVESACVKQFGKNKFSLVAHIGICRDANGKKQLGIKVLAVTSSDTLKKEIQNNIDVKFNQQLMVDFQLT